MIRYKIRQTPEGIDVRIRGHANYAQGDDIVCAGVSVLAQSVLLAANRRGLLRAQRVGKGNLEMTLVNTGDTRSFVAVLIDGLADLAEQYPMHVEGEVTGWTQANCASGFGQP